MDIKYSLSWAGLIPRLLAPRLVSPRLVSPRRWAFRRWAFRRERLLALFASSAIVLFGFAAAAQVEVIDPQAEYQACMALAQSDPKAAIERAGQWEGLGGGAAAIHCRAVATDADGHPGAAAMLLEELATAGKQSPALTADLLRQAAAAWTRAGQSERAAGVLDAALNIQTADPRLYEARAIYRAENGALWDAIDDLNQALDLNPAMVSALILRAAAYRRLEALDLADVDLQRAIALGAQSADLWLEKGMLALAKGNPAAAREDWITGLRQDPKGPVAATLRYKIEELDVRTE